MRSKALYRRASRSLKLSTSQLLLGLLAFLLLIATYNLRLLCAFSRFHAQHETLGAGVVDSAFMKEPPGRLPKELESKEADLRNHKCSSKKIDIILPIRETDWDLFVLQWESFQVFAKLEDFQRFFIITPGYAIDNLHQRLLDLTHDATSFEVRRLSSAEEMMKYAENTCNDSVISNVVTYILLNDEWLIPDLNSFPWNWLQGFHGTGWRRQQMVKLAMANIVQSQFFLVLDSDIMVVRLLSQNRLIVDGKAVTSMEPVRMHPEWWAASQEVLGVPPISTDTIGLSVTPAILHRNSIRAMLTYLESSAQAAMAKRSVS